MKLRDFLSLFILCQSTAAAVVAPSLCVAYEVRHQSISHGGTQEAERRIFRVGSAIPDLARRDQFFRVAASAWIRDEFSLPWPNVPLDVGPDLSPLMDRVQRRIHGWSENAQFLATVSEGDLRADWLPDAGYPPEITALLPRWRAPPIRRSYREFDRFSTAVTQDMIVNLRELLREIEHFQATGMRMLSVGELTRWGSRFHHGLILIPELQLAWAMYAQPSISSQDRLGQALMHSTRPYALIWNAPDAVELMAYQAIGVSPIELSGRAYRESLPYDHALHDVIHQQQPMQRKSPIVPRSEMAQALDLFLPWSQTLSIRPQSLQRNLYQWRTHDIPSNATTIADLKNEISADARLHHETSEAHLMRTWTGYLRTENFPSEEAVALDVRHCLREPELHAVAHAEIAAEVRRFLGWLNNPY